ncbi:unnamed protein product [Trichogramma brassicae]|uniref:Reverse transcriptase RNase H-like domain-containing protein n=1 Tax=Trichogramma brassicae TaxID=86971 RepID=A0A6H5IYF5_9HYME|nr:unnamed protein product [Trichogramma brassicae]
MQKKFCRPCRELLLWQTVTKRPDDLAVDPGHPDYPYYEAIQRYLKYYVLKSHEKRPGTPFVAPPVLPVHQHNDNIDQLGMLPMHMKVALCDQFGRYNDVKAFLESGQDPNLVVRATSESPLHLALVHNNRDVAALLLRCGADPNWANEEGSTPLHIICEGEHETHKRFGSKTIPTPITIKCSRALECAKEEKQPMTFYDYIKCSSWRSRNSTQRGSRRRKCLTSAPNPDIPDFSKPFILTTDASDLAIGAVLSQEKEGFEHPIGYLSRVLNKQRLTTSTTEKECLAALYAMYQYRPYLLGRPFTLVADHEPLNWMQQSKRSGTKTNAMDVQIHRISIHV